MAKNTNTCICTPEHLQCLQYIYVCVCVCVCVYCVFIAIYCSDWLNLNAEASLGTKKASDGGTHLLLLESGWEREEKRGGGREGGTKEKQQRGGGEEVVCPCPRETSDVGHDWDEAAT